MTSLIRQTPLRQDPVKTYESTVYPLAWLITGRALFCGMDRHVKWVLPRGGGDRQPDGSEE